MAGMTKAQAETAAQVDAICARIVVLLKEGAAADSESINVLKADAEAEISSINGSGSAGVKKALRDQVRGALETKADEPTAEVAVMADWLNDLVEEGAKEVQHLAETNMRGGQTIANILLDIRRRNLREDGTPDLLAELQTSKDAARDIFSRYTENLDPDSDVARQRKRIKRESQNTMVDTRVRYAKALDQAPAKPEGDEATPEALAAYGLAFANWTAEVALYDGKIAREEGQPLSEAVAAHYGFKLMTRSELTMAAKKAKELEAAQTQDEGDEGDSEGAGSAGGAARERTPVEVLTEALDIIGRQMMLIGSLEFDEVFPDMTPEQRKTTVTALGGLVTAAKGYHALATVSADVEDDQATADATDVTDTDTADTTAAE